MQENTIRNKKKLIIGTCSNMHGSQNNYAEWNKAHFLFTATSPKYIL